MALLRPWVREELKCILDFGKNNPAVPRRSRTSYKKHVQCIEVDEACSALKINDGDTAMWCFVSTPGVKEVSLEVGKQ